MDTVTPQDAAHALAGHGAAIWGDRTTDPADALAVLATVVGDIARAVRDQRDADAGEPDWAALTRELDGWLTFDRRADLHIRDANLRAVLPTGPTVERPRNINLNTVIVSGSPPVQLAARISGHCEVHGYVEGADRKWFADLVDVAVNLGVFRAGWSEYRQRADQPNGWRQVANLARESDRSPLVMSYSVCESFPNPEIAAWPEHLPDGGWDSPDWRDLDDGARWEAAVAGLRRNAEEAWLLRLSPDNLGSAAFGTERALTWFTLAEAWGR